MTFQVDSFRQAAAAVCARDGVEVSTLPAGELLELSGEVARVRRDADVLMAVVASEIRRRSEPGAGVGLAVVQGFRSVGDLIAQATGGSFAEANRLIATGDLLAEATRLLATRPDATQPDATQPDATQPDATLPGVAEPDLEGGQAGGLSPLTRFRMSLAEAVQEGRIGVEVSAVFTTALAKVPDGERTADLFGKALGKAPGLPLQKVRALVMQAQAWADVKAWEEREERQYEARAVTVKDDVDGMVVLTARLTPLLAAPVRAVLDAGVRWAMKARRDDPASDPRTPWQMRADILTDLCKHALDCTHVTSGVKTTVVVRVNQTDLKSGLGVGEIDGLPQPVTAAALRRAAVDAQIVPIVLGEDSDILDWGRKHRLFSDTQRLALVERDGGCAWCNAPPSWCDAHHIRWWNRDTGPTNLDNGILLCERCHHRIHRDGWDIEIRDHIPTFIPPPSIDPARTPRQGGRERYRIAA